MKTRINQLVAAAAGVAVLAGIAVFARTQFDTLFHSTFATLGGREMMDSSRYVSASVAGHGQHTALTLHIASGWHVNANPASLEYLIPTTLSIERNGALREIKAVYPPGRNSGVVLDGKDIQVYEDGTVIPFSGLMPGEGDRIVVRVQACNTKGICLPPADVAASNDKT
ncbi:protein-disulfide reductase DsbD domain-containing protein [Bordetella sp. FB-8]|uniref:protein-disulfide reductase DsbD domain-containing protein n=1 Tax=Bordetella sp. FB-8 TaxID=1159870 RepID=UPI00037C23F5|nr:protein-disulfide reductase DsbD domain-containing protein [Bordetella sp. FB-8]